MKILFALAVVIALTACTGGGDLNECSPSSVMLVEVNKLRSESRFCGSTFYSATSSLQLTDSLNHVADLHSTDMSLNAFVSHVGTDGSTVRQRADKIGYQFPVGENVSGGTFDLENTLQEFIKSEGHCKNIMNPNATEFGSSCKIGKEPYSIYWTQVFGIN